MRHGRPTVWIKKDCFIVRVCSYGYRSVVGIIPFFVRVRFAKWNTVLHCDNNVIYLYSYVYFICLYEPIEGSERSEFRPSQQGAV